MQYIAYHFTVDPPQPGSEILMAMIAEMGFDSFDNNETGFTAYIKEDEEKFVTLDELFFEDFKFNYTIEKIPLTNWNAEWEKNFEPVKLGNSLLIRAPFHEPDAQVSLEIVIMPRMSFGTGHHLTTRLMCMAMLETDLKNKRVLDMGCGTGVLAILAEKLGASNILAIDIDEWSVKNCMENCESNNCTAIEVKPGDVNILESEKPFDIILANINKNILKAHLKTYSTKLKSGGALFLSGFFKTDAEELTKAAEAVGLKFHAGSFDRGIQDGMGEWTMMKLEKIKE